MNPEEPEIRTFIATFLDVIDAKIEEASARKKAPR
jgi:hypothetical protein